VVHTGITIRAHAEVLISQGFKVHYLVGKIWSHPGRQPVPFDLD